MEENFDHMIDTDSRYVLWLKCQGKLLNLDESVLFGPIYIPPEYTKYSFDEAFNELEREYLNLSNTTKYVCNYVNIICFGFGEINTALRLQGNNSTIVKSPTERKKHI
jgi:hypothetical protein